MHAKYFQEAKLALQPALTLEPFEGGNKITNASKPEPLRYQFELVRNVHINYFTLKFIQK